MSPLYSYVQQHPLRRQWYITFLLQYKTRGETNSANLRVICVNQDVWMHAWTVVITGSQRGGSGTKYKEIFTKFQVLYSGIINIE